MPEPTADLLCGLCLAEVELGALRCKTCGVAFQGSKASGVLEARVDYGASIKLESGEKVGESVGATFVIVPKSESSDA